MKKVFFALMCAAAVVLAGCSKANNPIKGGTTGSSLTAEQVAKMDNTTEKCWHVAENIVVNGHSATYNYYEWGTEQEIASMVWAEYQAAKKMAVGDYEVAYEESSAKTQQECDKLDAAAQKENSEIDGDDDEDAECWQVYTSYAGQTVTLAYLWTSEEGVKEYVAAMNKAQGGAVTYQYKKADAKDEAACGALLGGDGNQGGQGEGGGQGGDQGKETCWKVSWSYAGESDVEYIWTNEASVKAYVESIKSVGATASYEEVKGKDEYTCEPD